MRVSNMQVGFATLLTVDVTIPLQIEEERIGLTVGNVQKAILQEGIIIPTVILTKDMIMRISLQTTR
jgi:hypothetical protein